MKPRRRNGATLGLVAVSVLVIIMIGVGCYFLAKICGGGREMTNATDAGTLNVAKNALRSTQASVAAPSEFTALADPPGSGLIDLYTYNRAVAQALIVAMNAQDENFGTATTNAGLEFTQLKTLGTAIQAKLIDQATLAPAFAAIANPTTNSMKMFGGNAINQTGYDYALLKPAGSTNIAFYSATFPNGNPPPNLIAAVATQITPEQRLPGAPPLAFWDTNAGAASPGTSVFSNQYMAGYQSIGPVAGQTFIGVPVFPAQKPHLVTLTDFKSAADRFTDPAGWTPPNCFSLTSQSKESTSNTFGGAVSCAIVGCANPSNQANMPYDFAACLPNGFVALSNFAPAPLPSGWNGPSDGDNNIFNWELNPAMPGPGINMTNFSAPGSGGPSVFFQDTGSGVGSIDGNIQQWIDYNAAGDPNPPATWNDTTAGNPNAVGQPPIVAGIYATPDGSAAAPATVADMKTVHSHGTNCLTDLLATNMGFPGPSDSCWGANAAMSAAYGRSPPGSGFGTDAAAMGNYWSGVDSVKEQVCAGFNTPYIGVTRTNETTGLGAYKFGKSDSPWNGGNLPPLEKPMATVMDLLDQVGVGTCATTATVNVIDQITQRANQIVPGVQRAEIVSLLSSPQADLIMGQTIYLRKQNAAVPSSGLIVSIAPPPGVVVPAGGWKAQADGNPATGLSDCHSPSYDVVGSGLVDSTAGSGVGDGKGDDNLHDRPYTDPQGNINATDHADFVLSSGYKNLLGVLEFSQVTNGSDSFSRPN